MNRKYFIILILFLFLQSLLNAQIYCGTEKLLNERFNKYPELKKEYVRVQKEITEEQNRILSSQSFYKNNSNDTIWLIDVVVHVVHNNGPENISDQQILSQIEILNNDFRKKPGTLGYNTNPVGADTRIEFRLATKDTNGNASTGIIRIQDATPFFDQSTGKDKYLKGLSYWDARSYLNIWVCKLDQTEGLLGYTQMPGSGNWETDGVVINYSNFGNIGTVKYPYNAGRITTHEIGHWLNLIHTWGDGGCGVDDYLSDTPNCSNQWFAVYPDCKKPNYQSPVQCGNNRQIENYLDYSDDSCMNMFTFQQGTRMRTTLFSFRPQAIADYSLTTHTNDQVVHPTDIIIFPNPSKGIFQIEIRSVDHNEPENIEIYNYLGQKVFYKTINKLSKNFKDINVENVSSGMYLVIFNSRYGKSVKRIILEN